MEKILFFSKNLRSWLFAHDTTHEQLAQRLGVKSISTIGRWTKDNNPPPGPSLLGLANLMGYTTDELLYQDLTWRIIQESPYMPEGSTVAEKEWAYGVTADKQSLQECVAYIRNVQDQLRSIIVDGDRILEAVK